MYMTNWHQWQEQWASPATLQQHEEQSWLRAYRQDLRRRTEPQRCSCWDHDVRQEAHGPLCPMGKETLQLPPPIIATYLSDMRSCTPQVWLQLKSEVGSWQHHRLGSFMVAIAGVVGWPITILCQFWWPAIETAVCRMNRRRCSNHSPVSLATTRFRFRVSTCTKKA